jgi:sugar lactone lactonase YvrE
LEFAEGPTSRTVREKWGTLPTNQVLLTLNTGHYGQGEGIAVDSQGNIYLAFGVNTINVYDSTGTLINTLH